MNRVHALVVSVVLGTAGVAGAVATTRTMHLGAASASPAQVDRSALRTRTRRLDTWSKALARTLAKRPPALPAMPRFAPVAIPSYAATAIPVARTVAATPEPTSQATALHIVASTRVAGNDLGSSTATAPRPRLDDPPAAEPGDTTTTADTTAAATAPAPPPVTTLAPTTSSDDGEHEQDPPEPGDDGK